MGIQGLIPFLDKASRPINISEFSGATVAVDAYCWLHKGAFSCAEKLARGEKCDAYVYYCMKFITMLLSHKIKPILVFDGRHLPAKAETEKKRRANRELNRRRAAELLRQDKPDQARTFIRRCVDITHRMALELMEACRACNVDCITAPYEADAQLAYLNLTGIAHLIITEDSDLILFGCKKVVFKMDLNGGGLLVEQENLHLSMKLSPENYSFDKFRRMCILSGCDYLSSLPGIGLSKACRFISRTTDPDIHRALTRMGSHLNMSLVVTKEYRDSFVHAEAMFKHQPVFDPIKRKVVPLTPIEPDTPPLNLPPPIPEDQAYQLALGNLEPFTLETVCNFDPDNRKPVKNSLGKMWCNQPSIWSVDYKPKPPPPPRNLKAQRPLSTAGKQYVQNTENIIPLCNLVDDSDVEAVLMECDKPPPKSPPMKRICLDDTKITSDINLNTSINKNSMSPDLSSSSKYKQTDSTDKCKRKRQTVISNQKVFSRYFFSPSSSEELKSELENSPTVLDNIVNEEKEKDDRLQDLSNILSDKFKVDVNVSPKKNKCSKSDIENVYFETTDESFNDSFDILNKSDSSNVSSQNSFTRLSQTDSQTNNKSNSSSLFKWKTQFQEKFSYAKAKFQKTSQSVNKDFQSPKTLSENCDKSFEAKEENCVSDRSQLSNESDKIESRENVPVVNEQNCLSVEKKSVSNPFKMRSTQPKMTSPNFSLIRDAVPEQISQDIDESFVNTPDTSTKKKQSTPTTSSQKKLNSSAKKCRSVGLSKKTTTGPTAQKSLLSMFMFKHKPQLQC